MKKKLILLLVCSASIIVSVQTALAQSWLITGNNNTSALSKLGTTNFIPLNLVTNDTTRVRIDEIGRVGIGTTTPVNILTVKSTAGNPSGSWLTGLTSPVFVGFADNASSEFVLATASNVSVRRSVIQGRKSRGTLAVPAVVANNDYLTSFLASGYDGSAFQNPATIDFFVDGVPSAGNVPARISFVTGSNQGNRQERLKVGSTGNFNFNGNQLTIQQSTGDVGIGIGDLNFSNGFQSIQFSNPGASSSPMINLFESGTTNNNRMVIGHSLAFADWGLQYSDAADDFEFLSSGTSVLHIGLGSQKVGVGTTAPAARLHVAGNASETTPVIQATTAYVGTVDVVGISALSKPADGYGFGVSATGGYRGGYFFGSGGAYTGGVIGVQGVATGTAGTHYGVFGSASGGTENWGGYFTTKTYTNELRVGGTTGAAGYVAAINGRLIATEVRVELIANWPDYVFNKGYKLMPIEELEASINAEKHLPGIPAASEMKENGIMLGEMQTKTIEKVEENTLYIIQLNNKIKLLEAKIDELTKKIK